MANKAVCLLSFNFGAYMEGFNRAMAKAEKKLTKFGKNLMGKGKNLLSNIGSKLGFGGAGGGNEDAEAGKKLLKEEAKAEMEGDTAMVMKLHTGKKKQ